MSGVSLCKPGSVSEAMSTIIQHYVRGRSMAIVCSSEPLDTVIYTVCPRLCLPFGPQPGQIPHQGLSAPLHSIQPVGIFGLYVNRQLWLWSYQTSKRCVSIKHDVYGSHVSTGQKACIYILYGWLLCILVWWACETENVVSRVVQEVFSAHWWITGK